MLGMVVLCMWFFGITMIAMCCPANGLLEGKPAEESWKEFRMKFLSIFAVIVKLQCYDTWLNNWSMALFFVVFSYAD